ncbi:hypothetical protein, partial [Pengzhenrongella sp.]|uniref:hypothetical protein n=1 Tax=Pengzhenrongella sp. TaxID=2888820 RepID=UPI002F91D2E4
MGTDTQVRTAIDALAGVSSTGVRRRASRGGAERRRRAHRAPQARRPSRIHRRAGTDAALMSALTSTVPADLSVPQLEVALTTLAGHLNAATCRFLVLLGEFDAREGWAMDGIVSCAHWLTWRCSLTNGAAREHVRVARAIR